MMGLQEAMEWALGQQGAHLYGSEELGRWALVVERKGGGLRAFCYEGGEPLLELGLSAIGDATRGYASGIGECAGPLWDAICSGVELGEGGALRRVAESFEEFIAGLPRVRSLGDALPARSGPGI